MPSQRITIAKLGGVSAEIALQRMSQWSAARNRDDPTLWAPEQWPDQLRKDADDFADQLRAHAFVPPVVYFVEWADLWSMFYLFEWWMTPPDQPKPLSIHADRFEIYAYSLPDDRRLATYLADAGPQQWPETDWFIQRMREAIAAWDALVERAVLIVIRQVVGGLVTDEEMIESMQVRPDWLS